MRTGSSVVRTIGVTARLTRTLTVLAGVLALYAILAGAPAHAVVTRPYTGLSFGPAGAGSGGFSQVGGVAVDQRTGDVFVFDDGEGGRVYKFDANGEPVDFASSRTNAIENVGTAGTDEEEIAVDSSSGPDAGDIYVATKGVVRIYAESGAYLEELSGGEMCGVAVDSTGTVYVGIYPETVRRYASSANPVTNADETGSMGGLLGICNIAVDDEGSVYAASYLGAVIKYGALQFGSLAATGTTVDSGSTTALAAEQSGHDVFIDERGGSQIAQYDGSIEPPTRTLEFGVSKPSLNNSYGVAVDHASGRVYAGDGSLVQVFGPQIVTGPLINNGPPFEVGFSQAGVEATVEAPGETVTYWFEYGTTVAYGSSTATTTTSIGSSQISVRTELTGLQPETAYHVRLVAESPAGTTHGPDFILTTHLLVNGLPDDRVYEKVSPDANADSNILQDSPGELGAEYIRSELPFAVSEDGDALVYVGGPSESGGSGSVNEYLANRATEGWQGKNITPASAKISDNARYQSFSPDLSVGFFTDSGETPLTPGTPSEGYSILYGRTFENQDYEALVTTKPPHRPSKVGFVFGTWEPLTQAVVPTLFAGSSDDRSHLLFEANDALTANAIDGGAEANNLYDNHNGALTLVNVLPGGGSDADATFGGPALPLPTGTDRTDGPAFAHDISADGSRIFWTDLNTHNLYMRVNDTAPQSPEEGGHCTVASEACTLLIAKNAQFWNASPDGSKVLYSSGGDLYEYDSGTNSSTDIAVGAELQGVVAASEDLSEAYFVSDAAIASGASQQQCTEVGEQQEQEEEEGGKPATAGCNLYAVHIGDSPHFIANLSVTDNYDPLYAYTSGVDGDWRAGLANKVAEATPDGSHLLFLSRRSLTGFPTRHRFQAYLYEVANDRLSCVSCNQSGETVSTSNATSASTYLPLSKMNTMLPHWISNDGNRVFFGSVDGLVPQDTNGAADVYEWERASSGTCTNAPGCIFLLSDGTNPEGSFLIGASTSGNDVFFTTRGQLADDGNGEVDVYDARADAMRPPVPSQCSGTGCQGVPSTPPVFATPASATYSGIGNFAPKSKPVAAKKRTSAKKRPAKKKCSVGTGRRRACRQGSKARKSSSKARGRAKMHATRSKGGTR
jgi:hypothetical protein